MQNLLKIRSYIVYKNTSTNGKVIDTVNKKEEKSMKFLDDTCTQNGILKAGKHLESRNKKCWLDFQNSELHFTCGFITFGSVK